MFRKTVNKILKIKTTDSILIRPHKMFKRAEGYLVVVAEPLCDEDERVEDLLREVGYGGVVLGAAPAHLIPAH